MAWKGLHITQPCRLSISHSQIVVERDDGAIILALEDVAWIVVDTMQASMTAAFISRCGISGISILFSGDAHLPSSILLPFHTHHRQSEIAQIQLHASLPLKKRLWKTTICAKINNQSSALTKCSRSGGEALKAMGHRVLSGDPNNVEAQAAKTYWSQLWDGFTRKNDLDARNARLNYGYTIIRSLVARSLVAHGLLPSLGIHHCSNVNAYNLADDMMEPFRPFVDVCVVGMSPTEPDITIAEKRILAAVPFCDISIAGNVTSLFSSVDLITESLIKCYRFSSSKHLLMPSFVQ